MSERPTIISIVSGKGGTGKTLLTAVLGRALAREGLRVLLVDLDIFVRGLTILLSEYTKRAPAATLTVVDFLNREARVLPPSPGMAVAARFFECDVLPATRDIGEAVDYDEFIFTSTDFRAEFLQRLRLLAVDYDVVLLDCRAGIDSLVVETAALSTLVLSVAEDDDVCLQANTNLINYLRFRAGVKGVFTIINKARRVHSYRDLQDRGRLRTDFNYAGVIPFDIEVMQDFGKDRFWTTVYETLYFRAMIDAWNYLSDRAGLPSIAESRYRFPPSIFMSPRAGRLPLVQRMLRLYGAMLVLCGVAFYIYNNFLAGMSLRYVWTLLSLVLGSLTILASTVNLREWLLGSSDNPRERERPDTRPAG
jgi:septum site-determining protein MinD